MDNETIKRQIRELCRSPQPERKAEFFQYIKHQGLMNKRSFRLSQGEFLAGQIAYIEKRIWLLSAFLLLFITWICRHSSGNYPFALTPFLASGILAQTRRSFHWKMAEMEYVARFSLRSVILARMFLLGAADTAGLMIVILLVRPCFSYSLTRVFLYMMVPYLTASWLGSVYERKQRTDHGWGSVLICFLSSAAFAAAPVFFERLYEERLTVIWAAVFALLTFSLAGSIREWICGMEEPVWN